MSVRLDSIFTTLAIFLSLQFSLGCEHAFGILVEMQTTSSCSRHELLYRRFGDCSNEHDTNYFQTSFVLRPTALLKWNECDASLALVTNYQQVEMFQENLFIISPPKTVHTPQFIHIFIMDRWWEYQGWSFTRGYLVISHSTTL